jgi:hypothetical protein
LGIDMTDFASPRRNLALLGSEFPCYSRVARSQRSECPRLTSSPLAFVAFAVTFILGYGATFNCLYALVLIIFGLKNLGRTRSSLFGIGLIGNAQGSIATGVLRSRYETYGRAFLITGITTWTNMIVFAVTKHFVAGSMEKSEETAEVRLQQEYNQAFWN